MNALNLLMHQQTFTHQYDITSQKTWISIWEK